ncbi:MAG: 3-mercaptopyruvate sulfurtransferase [Pseudomonadota bacterium]|jgi:thiosulfate/3-mercaptopyruvate sulfurtransferase
MYSTLISVEQLKAISAVVIDCSADLAKPEAGRAQFEEQHIAGALFADINTDLASHNPALAVNGGRHPLPSREHFALWLSACGISEHTQVVVYDRQGMNYCGRLWWMLKWCGHEAVAVLDGGLQAWAGAGGALASGPALPVTQAEFTLREPLLVLKHTAEVFAAMGRPAQTLVDARSAARYKGETEPFDPVAGHIPGALNRPFNTNLNAQGFMKSPAELAAEFTVLLNGRDASSVVHHCGSGISAIPNLLAMEVAGLGSTALYAGSWSEWCNTPGLPCAQA